MFVNTPGELGLVILNQQEVEQLVPDFKKYKMDSMFILLPQGITIGLVGVKH